MFESSFSSPLFTLTRLHPFRLPFFIRPTQVAIKKKANRKQLPVKTRDIRKKNIVKIIYISKNEQKYKKKLCAGAND